MSFRRRRATPKKLPLSDNQEIGREVLTKMLYFKTRFSMTMFTAYQTAELFARVLLSDEVFQSAFEFHSIRVFLMRSST